MAIRAKQIQDETLTNLQISPTANISQSKLADPTAEPTGWISESITQVVASAPTWDGSQAGQLFYVTSTEQLYLGLTSSPYYQLIENSSLDGVYNGGSTITVDNTDIIFNLSDTKNFKIQSDSGSTELFTISADSVGDSVVIKTTFKLNNGTYDATLSPSSLTSNKTITLPDVTGTLACAITSGGTDIGAVAYNGTTQANGNFDGGVTTPTHTTRLNYDGILHATGFYTNGNELISAFVAGSPNSGTVIYNGITQADGRFDGGATSPVHTTVLNYDGILRTTHVIADGKYCTPQTSGSSDTGTVMYGGLTNYDGCFDGGVTNPAHTTRLNYSGYFYATAIYSEATLCTPRTSGSASIGTLKYNGTTQANGNFDGGVTTPTHTTRLNYDGSFHCTDLAAGAVSIPGVSTENRILEIGYGRTGNGNSYIDLIGDATYTDYGLRLIRYNTGANTPSELRHRGTGAVIINAVDASGSFVVKTADTIRVTVTDSLTTIATPLSITGTTQTSGCFDASATAPTHTTRLNYDGNLYCTSLTQTSGKIAKKDIVDYTDSALDIIATEKIKKYKYAEQPDDDQTTHIGVLAEDANDEITSMDKGGIKIGSSIFLLFKAIQELNEKVEEIKNKDKDKLAIYKK